MRIERNTGFQPVTLKIEDQEDAALLAAILKVGMNNRQGVDRTLRSYERGPLMMHDGDIVPALEGKWLLLESLADKLMEESRDS